MHHAYKNRRLSARQKLANQLISKKRYIVEQCSGTIKRLFRMGRASYFGTVKVNAQVILKSICMNLKKSSQQNLRGSTIEENSSKKGKNLTFYQNDVQ